MIATGRGLPGLRRAIPALHGVNASGRAEFTRISPDQPGNAADLPVAGRFYSFGMGKAGRARGDFDEQPSALRALVCPPKSGDVATELDILATAIRNVLG